jgi:hypothetical protein
MEVLIFISYRVNTLESKVFRQFVNSALRDYVKKEKPPKEKITLSWLYSPQWKYW